MKIEGKNAVSELLKSGKDVDVLLAEKGTEHPIIAMARERGVKIQFVDRYILDKESMTGKHQGFIARVSGFEYCGLEDIIEEAEARNEKPFIVVLDGIEDPHQSRKYTQGMRVRRRTRSSDREKQGCRSYRDCDKGICRCGGAYESRKGNEHKFGSAMVSAE